MAKTSENSQPQQDTKESKQTYTDSPSSKQTYPQIGGPQIRVAPSDHRWMLLVLETFISNARVYFR